MTHLSGKEWTFPPYQAGDICKYKETMSLHHTAYEDSDCKQGRRLIRKGEIFLVLGDRGLFTLRVLLADGPAWIDVLNLESETTQL